MSVPGGFYGAEGFAYEAGAAAPLTVTEDGVDLDIVLPPTHYLRGRITGGTVALANAEVDVFLDGWPFTHGFTASDGTYAIAVPPGAYVVGVYDPGKKYAQGFVGASGYVSDPGLAKLVGVGLADVTGVNLSLPSMKRISGKVLRGSSTSVVPYVFVEAFVNDRFFASQYATSSGTFNLPVTPGKVTLWVYDTDLWGAPGWRTSTGITANRASAAVTTVSTANVSGIVIREAQAVLWRANLWWVPAPGSQASVPGGVEAIAYGEAASFDIQDGSGNRYLPLLKASYRFWIESDEGAYSLADGWYKSGGTVTPDYAQALVKAVTTSGTLTVTVPQGVEVAGSVSDGVVGLDAVDVQVWSNGAFFTDKVVNTGFDFTLAAGTYRLAFVDLYDHHLTGWLGDDGFVYDYADARDIVVASDWVQNLNVTLPMGPPPSSPAGVSATPFHASAAVSFSPVPTGLTRPILHYAVTASPGGRQCITTTTSCTVTGLADGTPYTFTVTASSMTGPSAPSIASAAVTPRPVPDAPTALTATPDGADIDVSWTAAVDNGSAVTGYLATVSPGGQTCVPTPANGTGCSIAGLVDGHYTVIVRATNALGDGPVASVPVTVDTVAPGVTAPVVTLRSGLAMTGTSVPVSIAWSASDQTSGIADTTLELQVGSAGAWSDQALTTATATSYLRTLPSSTSTYRFRDRAADVSGNVSANATGSTNVVTLVQETGTGITYSGSWSTSSTSTALGSKMRVTSARSASVTYTFTGRGVTFVSRKSTRPARSPCMSTASSRRRSISTTTARCTAGSRSPRLSRRPGITR